MELIIIWFPKLKLFLTYSNAEITEALYVGISANDNEHYIIPLNKIFLPNINNSFLQTEFKSNIPLMDSQLIFFIFKNFKYIYIPQTDTFTSMNFELNSTYYKIHSVCSQGLTQNEVTYQRLLHGECDLHIQVNSFIKILFNEFTDPFYIFQVCSIILWMSNAYEAYATMIIIATLLSLFVGTNETRQNLLNIQSLAKYSCNVKIYRKGERERYDIIESSSTELVPGDLFEVQDEGFAMPCDCILLKGTVIINESMLTGESTPIIKTPIPYLKEFFDIEKEKKNFLFAGTKVIQKRTKEKEKVLALAYRTGFNTAKGNLIRSILFPKEVNFKFKKDSVKYIILMTFLSFFGFGVSLPFLLQVDNLSTKDIILKSLDLITTTVPPALPACLGFGISYALRRLKKVGIICINRDRVNLSGKVNMICFDKTGTLTEDHLDIYGFVPVKVKKEAFFFSTFDNSAKEFSDNAFEHYKKKRNLKEKDKNKDMNEFFVECLATCHSATFVNGKLIGDPIDVKMFESCEWELLESSGEKEDNKESLISTYARPKKETDLNSKIAMISENEDDDKVFREHYELGIVRRFDFSSKLQRMSVIVKDVNDTHYKIFCKGSPEKIKELCRPETIPEDFNEQINKYTSKGLRVLAMSIKMIKMTYLQSQEISRERCEKDMIFLGLLIVQNMLKEKTKDSIEILERAGIRMVMATGDNILTAISVSRDCGLIKSNAVVYICDVKGNDLVWETVDNFSNDKEDNLMFENSIKSTNNLSNVSEDSFTQDFPPEEFSQLSRKEEDDITTHLLNEEIENQNQRENQNQKEQNDLDDSILLNIEVEKYPLREPSSNAIIIGITGPTFETLSKLKDKFKLTKVNKYKIYNDVFRMVLRHGYIFARMSPEHKTLLVENLRMENLTVLMCGDGANDCGALRAADIGVSLSPEEASIAAHFTSNIPDISCIIKLLREGKACLVTSIQTFKYMMMYSLIQFFSVTLLMIHSSYLTDNQFLATDVFIIFPIEFFIALTGAYSRLTHHRPTDSLISFPIISSILFQTAICFGFQFGALNLLKFGTSWYNFECNFDDDDNPLACQDNTVIYLIANMQYLISAFAFSISKPFRKPLYTNIGLTLFMVLAFAYSVYIIVYPDSYSLKLLGLVDLKEDHIGFLIILLGLSIANFVLAYVTEALVVPAMTKWYNKRQIRKLKEKGKEENYEYTLNEIQKIRNIENREKS